MTRTTGGSDRYRYNTQWLSRVLRTFEGSCFGLLFDRPFLGLNGCAHLYSTVSTACLGPCNWHDIFALVEPCQFNVILGPLTWFWIWICCSPFSLESCLTLVRPCQACLLASRTSLCMVLTCVLVHEWNRGLEESPPKMLFGWYWVSLEDLASSIFTWHIILDQLTYEYS